MCQLPSNVDVGNKSYDDEGDDQPYKIKPLSIKQQLLHTIGTEVLINRCLNGKVAVVQSDLQWFATSTSHATVDTILKFFGVPEVWRRLFHRYLEAPLRIVGLEGESANIRSRRVCYNDMTRFFSHVHELNHRMVKRIGVPLPFGLAVPIQESSL